MRITISAGRSDRRKRDIDNIGKALLDLLVKHRVIGDDANVVAISSAWSADVPAGRVLVAIKRAEVRLPVGSALRRSLSVSAAAPHHRAYLAISKVERHRPIAVGVDNGHRRLAGHGSQLSGFSVNLVLAVQ